MRYVLASRQCSCCSCTFLTLFGFLCFCSAIAFLQIKDQIRQAVFTGLSDSARKIRLACVCLQRSCYSMQTVLPALTCVYLEQASIVSEIASSDWPDEWPSLLDSLVQLLNSGHTDSVHGAMRVLSDFVSTDLSEDQLLPLSNAMLPQLLQILGDERVRALRHLWHLLILMNCLYTLVLASHSCPICSCLPPMHQYNIHDQRQPPSGSQICK